MSDMDMDTSDADPASAANATAAAAVSAPEKPAKGQSEAARRALFGTATMQHTAERRQQHGWNERHMH